MHCPVCLEEIEKIKEGEFTCRNCNSSYKIGKDSDISLLKRDKPSDITYVMIACNIFSLLFPFLLFISLEVKPDNLLLAFGLFVFLIQTCLMLYDIKLNSEHEKFDRRSYQYYMFIKGKLSRLDKLSIMTFYSTACITAFGVVLLFLGILF